MAEGGGQGRQARPGQGRQGRVTTDRAWAYPKSPRAPSPSHGSHGCRRISGSRISDFFFFFY
jgi:hypothetical protein